MDNQKDTIETSHVEHAIIPCFEYIKELLFCLIGIVIGNQLGVYLNVNRPILILVFGMVGTISGVLLCGRKWNYTKAEYVKKISGFSAFVLLMAGVGIIFH